MVKVLAVLAGAFTRWRRELVRLAKRLERAIARAVNSIESQKIPIKHLPLFQGLSTLQNRLKYRS